MTPETPALQAWHRAIAYIGTRTLADIPEAVCAAIVADPAVRRLHDRLWDVAQSGDTVATKQAGNTLNALVKRLVRAAREEVVA